MGIMPPATRPLAQPTLADRPAMHVLSFAAAAGLTALTTYLLVVGQAILRPFVIAIFASYLINALAVAGRRIRIAGRTPPRSLRFGVAIAVVCLLAWLAVNLVVSNVGQVIAAAPAYEKNLLQVVNRVGGRFGMEELPRMHILFEGVNLTGLVRRLGLGLTGLMGSLGVVAIYVVFLLLEQHSVDKKIAALFPDTEREALVHRILQRIGVEIRTYVWLKTLISAGTSIACYLVMKAVGLDLAEFWALLIFALNFIPYIGSWLGVIFPALLTLAQFETLTPFLATTGVLSVIQFTGGSIIEPRLMGSGLNLSPVVVLLSLAVWGSIWGVVGMLLAVPLMVVLMIVFSHFDATRPIAVLLSADGELRS